LSKVANFNLPHMHWAPLLGNTHLEIFGTRKLESSAFTWRCSRDPTNTDLWQTDRQTHTWLRHIPRQHDVVR